MASKFELASYLVSIHNLLEAQEATGVTRKSPWLVDEYNRAWAEYKEVTENETRQRKQQGVEP